MSYKPPSSRRMRRPLRKTEAAPVEPKVAPEAEAEVAPEPEPERARDDDGTFVADDPETPEVNEAFTEGEPLAKTWSKKSTKAVLLAFAVESGLTDLTNDNTKAEIVAALEAAEL